LRRILFKRLRIDRLNHISRNKITIASTLDFISYNKKGYNIEKVVEKQTNNKNTIFAYSNMLKQYLVYLTLFVWLLYNFTCSMILIKITISKINGMKYNGELLMCKEMSQ